MNSTEFRTDPGGNEPASDPAEAYDLSASALADGIYGSLGNGLACRLCDRIIGAFATIPAAPYVRRRAPVAGIVPASTLQVKE